MRLLAAALLAALALVPTRGVAQQTADKGADLATFDLGSGVSAQPEIYPYTVRKIGGVYYLRVDLLVTQAAHGVMMSATAGVRCGNQTARYGFAYDYSQKALTAIVTRWLNNGSRVGDLFSDPSGGLHDRRDPLTHELVQQLCE